MYNGASDWTDLTYMKICYPVTCAFTRHYGTDQNKYENVKSSSLLQVKRFRNKQ